jgi:hypothetical protein
MKVPQNLRKKGTTRHHITSTMLLDFLDGESNCRMNWIMLLILLLHYYNSLRNCHYLLRLAVVLPGEALWRKLYKKADDSSFLHMTGLNRHAFRCFLQYLFDDDEIVTHCRHERPCSLGPDGYLGLLLFYLGSTMQYKHLCLIFGLTPTVCEKVINWMLRRTVRLLNDHPFAKVRFPDDLKMSEFANMVISLSAKSVLAGEKLVATY